WAQIDARRGAPRLDRARVDAGDSSRVGVAETVCGGEPLRRLLRSVNDSTVATPRPARCASQRSRRAAPKPAFRDSGETLTSRNPGRSRLWCSIAAVAQPTSLPSFSAAQ